MWNWLKYLPLDWRKRQIDCVPRGPSFSRAPAVRIPIAGSQFRLLVPRHRPSIRGESQYRLLPGEDALDQGIGKNYGEGLMANDHWGFRTVLSRSWTFWGPWMTGAKAELDMAVEVIGRYDEFAFPEISYFKPRAFEMVLFHYLNDRYGHHQWDDGTPRWKGPTNWRTHEGFPVFSASCRVYKLDFDGITTFLPDHLLFFPITEKHFVEVSFTQHIYSFNKGEPAFDMNPVQALQDAIINSMTLELSPEAQAAWDNAKAECGDMTLTKNFAPLRRPTASSKAEEPPTYLQRHQ